MKTERKPSFATPSSQLFAKYKNTKTNPEELKKLIKEDRKFQVHQNALTYYMRAYALGEQVLDEELVALLNSKGVNPNAFVDDKMALMWLFSKPFNAEDAEKIFHVATILKQAGTAMEAKVLGAEDTAYDLASRNGCSEEILNLIRPHYYSIKNT